MCLCVGLSSLFPIRLPPPTLPSTLKELSEIWESYDSNYHLSSWWGHPFNKFFFVPHELDQLQVCEASSTPVSRSSHSTLGAHPLSCFPLSSPQFSPSSPHPSPVIASLPISFLPLPSLPALIASVHSLLPHLRQVTECKSVWGPSSGYFGQDIVWNLIKHIRHNKWHNVLCHVLS